MVAEAGQGQAERGALDALDAADAEGGGGEHGARGPGGEEAVGLARADRGGGAHDARALLLAHGVGGVLGHGDDLGARQRLRPVGLLAEGLDDVRGSGDEDLEVGVGERRGDALKKLGGVLVGTHDVNANGYHAILPRGSFIQPY